LNSIEKEEKLKISDIVAADLEKIRTTKPLVHHITNFVVMNDTANVTLHVGALPVMAHAPEEVEEMVSLAGALVLNPGTLTREWVESMVIAGRRANEKGIPVVLDPVGAGATRLRTESCQWILTEVKVDIVRGNAAEVATLAGFKGKVVGVESLGVEGDLSQIARTMAVRNSQVVAITGKTDVISDGMRIAEVENGHPMLSTITGTGCMATTMVAAFAAVQPDFLLAATGGLVCFGLAGEIAAGQCSGPGSFKVALMDAIANMTAGDLSTGTKAKLIDLVMS